MQQEYIKEKWLFKNLGLWSREIYIYGDNKKAPIKGLFNIVNCLTYWPEISPVFLRRTGM